MAEPSNDAMALPSRSWRLTLGAARLAWGVALLLALGYVAIQWPLEIGKTGRLLALTIWSLGVITLALGGWRQLLRGWEMRQLTGALVGLSLAELIIDLTLATALHYPILRAEQSRVLAAGLDRMTAAIIVMGLLSLLLGVIERWCMPADANAVRSRRLIWLQGLLATGLIVGIIALEAQPWEH